MPRAPRRGQAGGLRALARLIEEAHSTAPARFVSAVVTAARDLGAGAARVLLVDFQQELLIPVGPTAEAGPPVPVTGSVAGRAFVTGAPVVVEAADGAAVIVATPLLDGVERLGVLELAFPTAVRCAGAGAGAAGVDEWGVGGQRLAECRRFADLVTQYLASRGRYTDELHIARARVSMSLAAQMQWQVLPPLTAHAPAVTVAGQVEPAYHVGGDAFDYAINREVAHVAVFDAMGHGVPASVTTALAVGAYRHCRRRQAGLVDTLAALDEALAQEFADDRYMGGVVLPPRDGWACPAGRTPRRRRPCVRTPAGGTPLAARRVPDRAAADSGRDTAGNAVHGWRVKVADAVAKPVSKHSALSDDQVRAAFGAVFFALSLAYVLSTVRRLSAQR